jgi:hypothetical protein
MDVVVFAACMPVLKNRARQSAAVYLVQMSNEKRVKLVQVRTTLFQLGMVQDGSERICVTCNRSEDLHSGQDCFNRMSNPKMQEGAK